MGRTITLIYNPNSTGKSVEQAKNTAAELRRAIPDAAVVSVPTEYAGHAEELAYAAAKKNDDALIIAVSGDGGYNEVINGIMRAHQEGFNAVAGLIPAGNANDHFHSLHRGNFIRTVAEQKYQVIDVLKIASRKGDKPYIRYAHSYIGFGLTPHVGRALTKEKLNRFKEIWITFKTGLQFQETQLTVSGRAERYQSLVFSNTPRMARYLTLSKKANVHDGKFEVTAVQHRTKFRLALSLVRAMLTSFYARSQTNQFTLTTIRPTLVQFDGETTQLDARAQTTISIEPMALRCIV